MNFMTNFTGKGSLVAMAQNLLLCPSGMNYETREAVMKATINPAHATFFRNIDTGALCPFNQVVHNRNTDLIQLTTSGTSNVGRFTIMNPDLKVCLYEITLQLTPRSIVTDDYASFTVDISGENPLNYTYDTTTGYVTIAAGLRSGVSLQTIHTTNIRIAPRPAGDTSLPASNNVVPLHTSCYFLTSASKASMTIDVNITATAKTGPLTLDTSENQSWIMIRHIS
jgi:hypothetical protein